MCLGSITNTEQMLYRKAKRSAHVPLLLVNHQHVVQFPQTTYRDLQQNLLVPSGMKSWFTFILLRQSRLQIWRGRHRSYQHASEEHCTARDLPPRLSCLYLCALELVHVSQPSLALPLYLPVVSLIPGSHLEYCVLGRYSMTTRATVFQGEIIP